MRTHTRLVLDASSASKHWNTFYSCCLIPPGTGICITKREKVRKRTKWQVSGWCPVSITRWRKCVWLYHWTCSITLLNVTKKIIIWICCVVLASDIYALNTCRKMYEFTKTNNPKKYRFKFQIVCVRTSYSVICSLPFCISNTSAKWCWYRHSWTRTGIKNHFLGFWQHSFAVLRKYLNAAWNVHTQASQMHIHGCSAPHANCDLHTVMNSFDLWIHIFDLPHRCRVLAWHADFIFIVSVVNDLHLLKVLIRGKHDWGCNTSRIKLFIVSWTSIHIRFDTLAIQHSRKKADL